MHIALVPLPQLVGLASWLIARRAGRCFARGGALFGYGFAVFAGIAAFRVAGLAVLLFAGGFVILAYAVTRPAATA